MHTTNFVGKPCAGKPHARFDEGGRNNPPPTSTVPQSAFYQTKRKEKRGFKEKKSLFNPEDKRIRE